MIFCISIKYSHSVNNDFFYDFAKYDGVMFSKKHHSRHRSKSNISNMKCDLILIKCTHMRNPRLDYIVNFLLLETNKLINRLHTALLCKFEKLLLKNTNYKNYTYPFFNNLDLYMISWYIQRYPFDSQIGINLRIEYNYYENGVKEINMNNEINNICQSC